MNTGEGANVAFTAYLGHNMNNIQDKQKLVFEKVITNEGGFYNNTTGNEFHFYKKKKKKKEKKKKSPLTAHFSSTSNSM